MAEVFPETAYVADCDRCGYTSEFFETEREAQLDADWHNERCAEESDEDERTDREKFQDAMDAAVRGDHL